MAHGQGPSAVIQPALILLGFTVVFALLAAKLFRWDDLASAAAGSRSHGV